MSTHEPRSAQHSDAVWRLLSAGITDTGYVRRRNEDAFLVSNRDRLFAVADGLGGHNRGDVASQMAMALLPQLVRQRLQSPPKPPSDTVRALADSVEELSQRIETAGIERADCHGMGATLVAALIDAKTAYLAHMGDSRAYLLRKGELHPLTQDHSVVGMLVRRGDITAEEAEVHPARSQLTRFAGISGHGRPDLRSVPLLLGDRLLLCTDGIWGFIPQDELHGILAAGRTPRTTCRNLVRSGNAHGGHDNMAVVILDIQEP